VLIVGVAEKKEAEPTEVISEMKNNNWWNTDKGVPKWLQWWKGGMWRTFIGN